MHPVIPTTSSVSTQANGNLYWLFIYSLAQCPFGINLQTLKILINACAPEAAATTVDAALRYLEEAGIVSVCDGMKVPNGMPSAHITPLGLRIAHYQADHSMDIGRPRIH